MLVVNDRIQIPRSELKLSFSRASGPGGQNVNKVNSRVQLRWNLAQTSALPAEVLERLRSRYHRQISGEDDLCLASQRFRDQARNIDDVLDKLVQMIRGVATAPAKRIPTKVSRRQKQRRLDDKRKKSERKQGRRPME